MCVFNPEERVPCAVAVTIPILSKDRVSKHKDRQRSKARSVTISKRWSTRSVDSQVSARSESSSCSVSQASTRSADTTGRWKVLRDPQDSPTSSTSTPTSTSDVESLYFGQRSMDLEKCFEQDLEEEEEEQAEVEEPQREQQKEEEEEQKEEEEQTQSNSHEGKKASEVAAESRRTQMLAAREQELLEEMRKKRETVAKCQERLEDFLAQHGFSAVNEKKKTKGRLGPLSSGYTYPLHAAVQAADLTAIRLLLWGGADRYVTDSSNRTALSLALKLDKKGSHTALIEMLAD